ncbi:MAG: hypothetical protein AB7E36_04640 [Salinivirgaceae bacterium]
MSRNSLYKKLYRSWLKVSVNQAITKKRSENQKLENQVRFMVLFFFLGIFLSAIFGGKTLLTWNTIFGIYLVCGMLLSLIPLKYYPDLYKKHAEFKVLLIYFSLAPLITGLILTLNFNITSSSWVQSYPVAAYHLYSSEHSIEFELDDSGTINHIQLRRFSTDNLHAIPDSIAYEMHKGLFGITVVKKYFPIEKKSKTDISF